MILPIIKPRAGGKTTALIEWYLQDPESRCIITAHADRADMLNEQIMEREPSLRDRHAIMTVFVRRLLDGHMRGTKKVYAIDDLDDVLGALFQENIVAFTMTGPSHDGEGRELVDKDAVYAFVNQRPAEPERGVVLDRDEMEALIEDTLHPRRLDDTALGKLAILMLSIQGGVAERPAPISKNGKIRKSGEVVTFSNGTTMPLDMVLMLGATRMAETDEETSGSGFGHIYDSPDASRPSPE